MDYELFLTFYIFNCSSSIVDDFNTKPLVQSYLLAGKSGSQTPKMGPPCRAPDLPLR